MAELKLSGKDWRTVLTLVVAGLGISYFIVQALSLGGVWLTSFFDNQQDLNQTISLGLLIWSSILAGLLLLPVFLLSLYRLRGKDVPEWLDTSRTVYQKAARWLILVWPVFVLLGWVVAGRPMMASFLLGPINLMVAGIPILWIYNGSRYQLEGGPQIRQWRIFGFSLTILPLIIIIVELIALLIFGGILALWFSYRTSMDPALEIQLTALIDQLRQGGQDMETILELLRPYLLQPVIIFWALAIFGGIVPIIEEALKPLALWGLAGQEISPQEGFVGGLLCGAGFALTENILYFTTAIVAEDWLFMAIGRAGTGVLHMLASGMVGWGLAKAWRDKKWFFQALLTLGAFIFHGLWNALALATSIGSIYLAGTTTTVWQDLLLNLPVLLLLVVSAFVMFQINRHFRTHSGAVSDEVNSHAVEDRIEEDS